jgi:hypothetical protein
VGSKRASKHVRRGGSFRRKRPWRHRSQDRAEYCPSKVRQAAPRRAVGTASMRFRARPLFGHEPLRLPPNCRDVTAERVGTIIGIIGATAAGKGRSQDDRRRIDGQDRARAGLGAPFRRAGGHPGNRTRDARDAAREAAAFQGKYRTIRIFARGRSPARPQSRPW